MDSYINKKFLGVDQNKFWHESTFPLNNLYWHGPNPNENSIGFASDEFNEAADIVSLGCSFTYGYGVKKGITWGKHLANQMGMTYHSISGPGRSTMWAINNFFSYVSKFRNPKIVVALFPEFTRIQLTSQPHHMITKYMPEGKCRDGEIIRYAIYEHFDNSSKYFKLPFIAEEIFPAETAFDISLQYIKMLEVYCNSNNIKLLWSTWPKTQQDWLEENINKTEFKNFISIKTYEWHTRKEDEFYERYCFESHADGEICSLYSNCHLEYEKEYGINFYISDDRVDGVKDSHWGVHRHIHIADLFMKELNEYNTRN